MELSIVPLEYIITVICSSPMGTALCLFIFIAFFPCAILLVRASETLNFHYH